MARVKGKLIEELKLTEISLVDRPANKEATFMVMKFDNGGGENEMSKVLETLRDGFDNILKSLGAVNADDSGEPITKADDGGGSGDNPPAPVQKVDMAPVVEAIQKLQDETTTALTPLVEKLEALPEGLEEMVKFVGDNKAAIEEYVSKKADIDAILERADQIVFTDAIGDIDEISSLTKRIETVEEARGIRMSDPSDPVQKGGDDWGGVLGG